MFKIRRNESGGRATEGLFLKRHYCIVIAENLNERMFLFKFFYDGLDLNNVTNFPALAPAIT